MSDVTRLYATKQGGLHVLAGVSLEVCQGEFVTIIGPSGSGKSTLLNIAAGIEEPNTGQVALFGADGAPLAKRLGQVAYMPQRDLLLPWRTALDNATLGLELQSVSRAQARQRATPLLDTFGLSGFATELPQNLSGGMRQRVAFLRTVLAGKGLMLLDEPFGALDALTRADMHAWLLSLWQGLGRTALMVTHDVEEALLLSHKVYLLTASPGRVRHVLPVPLPWPRTPAMVATPEFVQLKANLLHYLRTPAMAL
ncbi:MAG: ABC transporter ATP-binding protein [Dehalococcoidia bacterium]|nr:ABC transporter ATP-binding protein [Dehalococcoidia bacterium]